MRSPDLRQIAVAAAAEGYAPPLVPIKQLEPEDQYRRRVKAEALKRLRRDRLNLAMRVSTMTERLRILQNQLDAKGAAIEKRRCEP